MNSYSTLNRKQLKSMLDRTSPHSFSFNIGRMHDIYKLPTNTEPTLDPLDLGENAMRRLKKFQVTLRDEIAEYDTAEDGKLSIEAKLKLWREEALSLHTAENAPDFAAHQDAVTTQRAKVEELRKDCLVDIADWLSDIIVYCRSEAMKFGLPLEDTIQAVMASNFTKLPSDGIPKYDANGKFLKDMSNFIPPEPAIKTVLFGISGDGVDHPYAKIDNS